MTNIADQENAEGQANDYCVKVSGAGIAWWDCGDWLLGL